MTESQQTREHPAPPEREPHRLYSPEAARMILSVTSKELVHPKNKLSNPYRQQFKSEIGNKTGENVPANAIAALSGESREAKHLSYDQWSANIKSWYEGLNDEAKNQAKGTFARLGITIEQELQQEQLDQFFDKYLDMQGSPNEYQQRYTAFVKGVADEFIDEGVLDKKSLDDRLNVLRPLLNSFGQKDIGALVEAHIQAEGFLSQDQETKALQADNILRSVETPITDPESEEGFKKLAKKLGITVIGEDEVSTPPPPDPGKPQPAETQSDQLLHDAEEQLKRPLSDSEKTYVLRTGDIDSLKEVDLDELVNELKFAQAHPLEEDEFTTIDQRLQELAAKKEEDITQKDIEEFSVLSNKLADAEIAITSVIALAILIVVVTTIKKSTMTFPKSTMTCKP